MTVTATATRVVPATAREVLEFVLDLDRYRQADHKIGKVSQPVTLDADNRGRVKYWGRMRGAPPAPDVNLVELDPWSSLTFTGAPRQPARLIVDFTGRFECAEVAGGCETTHSYEIAFRRPLRWIYEPLLRSWLQTELDAEMDRVVATFEEQK